MTRSHEDWLIFAKEVEDAADEMSKTTVWVGAYQDLRKAVSSIRWQVNWEKLHPKVDRN